MAALAVAVRLRPMRWWDVAPAQEIERDAFGADGWTEASFWAELGQRERRHFVVAEDEAGGGLLGYAGLALGADEVYVQTIAVRGSAQSRGIGSTLLEHLLETAAERPVLLEVRVDAERAQALYRRFGFVEIGRRRRYYQPSDTDALVMRRG